MDLAGVRMLAELYDTLGKRGITLSIADARGRIRDLLRAEDLDKKIAGVRHGQTLSDALRQGLA